MILLLDNYDSFTYNLRDYLEQLGAEVVVIRNDALNLSELDNLQPEGIVLSPGPGTPDKAGVMMELIDMAYEKYPIFGVCLGMQALALHFGGAVKRAEYPMHGKVSKISTIEHPMFEGMSRDFKVCRYHSLVVDIQHLRGVHPIAYTDLDELMAITDDQGMAWGVQFHPEAILSEGGKDILGNWLKHVNLHNQSKTFTDV